METGPRLSLGPGNLARRRGTEGEDRAVEHLRGLGYKILDRNFKTRSGELDIVARDGSTTVFVEVKRRGTSDHGSSAAFVDRAKIRKVVGAARAYAAKHGLSESPLRFDVVAIDGEDGREHVQHHKGAFDAS